MEERSICQAIGVKGFIDQLDKIKNHGAITWKAILSRDTSGREQKITSQR